MKSIKLFSEAWKKEDYLLSDEGIIKNNSILEGYNKEDYYTEVTGENNENQKDYVNISKSHIKMILDILPLKYKHELINWKPLIDWDDAYSIRFKNKSEESGINYLLISFANKKMNIVEMKDEYFMCFYEDKKNIESFKCDQIGGVIELIKDKSMIK